MIEKLKEPWKRYLIAVVNVFSLSCFVVLALLTAFVVKNAEEDILKVGYRKIMNHYAADMLDDICSFGDESAVRRYEDSNMEYSVYYSYNYKLELRYLSDDRYGMIYTNTDGNHLKMEYMFWLKEGYTFYGASGDNLYRIMTGNLKSDKVPESQLSVTQGKYYNIACKISDDIKEGDVIYDWTQFVTKLYDMKVLVIIGTYVSGIIYVISLIVLVLITGEKSKKKKIRLNIFDKLPFEVVTAVVVVLEVLLAMGIHILMFDGMPIIAVFLVLAIMAMVILCYMLSIARRVKAGKMYRYTIVRHISGPLDGMTDEISKNTPLLLRVVVLLTLLTLLELFVILGTEDEVGILIFCFAFYKIFEYAFVIYVTFEMWILKKGADRIADGNFKEKVDTSKLRGHFKEHGESINMVGKGIAIAVEEQMNSERMKTELITNVSHDIKTPLTSIINYVDLLKKENVEGETAKEYINVLDRQSLRLKKLIEDLMEASKASTGNVELNMEECDVKVVLSQALGEFEEKIAKAGIEMVVTEPEEEVIALVDGRHLWRVFDNLINNVCKYAMNGTRAYLNIKNTDTGVEISVKNISKEPLNISPDELMERFVRGDSSRNTEGSGLGLSIAKSLTELMGGTMELAIDGDLFKVMLVFGK